MSDITFDDSSDFGGETTIATADNAADIDIDTHDADIGIDTVLPRLTLNRFSSDCYLEDGDDNNNLRRYRIRMAMIRW